MSKALGIVQCGPLRLANLGSDKAVAKEIDRGVERLLAAVDGAAKKIYLVGGSWRAIARLEEGLGPAFPHITAKRNGLVTVLFHVIKRTMLQNCGPC